MGKRWPITVLRTVAVAILLTVVLSLSCARAASWPSVDAKAVVVMDAGSGRILYAYQPDERHLIASTTKIMTALVAIEKGNLDDMVTVSRQAARVEGSRIYLDEGERETLRDLLYALMLRSANDAAIAIAEHVGGSVEGFAQLMNEKARALGCQNTHFVNPHGLDHPDHYSSARDLAVIGAQAMKNPFFRQLVCSRKWEMPWPAKSSTRVLHNENKLLADEYGTGIKTGYTVASGHCVVASARREQFEVIVVMLDAGMGFWRDVRALLDHAFAHYRPVAVIRSGQPLDSFELQGAGKVQAVAGADLVIPLLPEETASATSSLHTQVTWVPGLNAPLQAGQRVGQVEVQCLDLPPAYIPLVAADAVAPLQPARPWPWLLLAGTLGTGILVWHRRRPRYGCSRYVRPRVHTWSPSVQAARRAQLEGPRSRPLGSRSRLQGPSSRRHH